MKRVLIITYYWPPSGGPGVQRVLKFCKYLPAFGWRPVVLTVERGEYPAIDRTLERDIDGSIAVYRTRALEIYSLFRFLSKKETIPTYQLSKETTEGIVSVLGRWIRLNLVVPDGRVGWYINAVRAGKRIIREEGIDVLFSSGPPHSVHLIGKSLARSGLPWVADFRDPWTDRFYYQEGNRGRFIARFDKRLERSVLDHATEVTTVSPRFKDLLAGKTNNPKKISVVYNGYDDADFTDSGIERSKGEIVITHMGTLSKSQIPDALFQALQRTMNSDGKRYSVRLNLVGNVHPDLLQRLEKHNIASITSCVPYLPHREVIRLIQASTFLFLVVPRTPRNLGIIPGKLFEYIRSKVPILLFGPPDCDAAEIVRNTRSGFALNYDDVQGAETILRSRAELRPTGFEVYSRQNQTRLLSKVFDGLMKDQGETR